LFILPLVWVPLRVGQLVIFSVSIWAVYASIGIFTQRRERLDLMPVIFMIGNLHFVHLLYLGQVDGLILIGLGWGWLAIRNHRPALFAAALVIMSTKPINIALAALLLVGCVRVRLFRAWIGRCAISITSGKKANRGSCGCRCGNSACPVGWWRWCA
jgi:hypothetical protein